MKKASSSHTRQLLLLVAPHLRIFILAMLALAGGSGINLLFPELIRRIINSDYAAYFFAHPTRIETGLIALFALQGVCFYFRSYLFGIIGYRVVAKLRQELYESLILHPVQFFDRARVGDLVSRLSSDTAQIQDAVSVKLSVFIRYSLQVVVGIILMIYISYKLTLAILILLPIIVGLSVFLGKKLKRYSKMVQAALGVSSNVAEETFAAARIVKAFNREKFEMARYRTENENVLTLGAKRARVSAFLASFVSFLMNACIVVIMLYGVHLVWNQALSAGDLTAFMLYGIIVAVSFAFIANGYTEFLQALGAAERVFEIINNKPLITTLSTATQLEKPVQGEVAFSHVNFFYPTRPEATVLQGVSFVLERGKQTALVGPSGAGKSTIVNLILRFYDPSAGTITFDGVNLCKLSPEELRANIAIVPQEPQLFAVSIAENLRYGKESASHEELEEVCRKANILEFINSLPQKFETRVGERGAQLSSGQRQRIAIARAMLKNPALLILDEATSALDSENELHIRNALATLLKGRTALIIAHRLSTIQSVDRLLVINHGEIVQSGTHEALTREPGLYKQLVERQEIVTGL